MKINEKIRKIRLDNKLTQEEFGDIINVSRSTVALYERGLRKPDINIISDICKHFNISINELYDESTISNKGNNKVKIILLGLIAIVLLISTIMSINFIRVTNMYGYNIYNDELKVKNSTDICIVKINNKICEYDEEVVYSINVVENLKENTTNKKYIDDKMTINKNNVTININDIYLLFNSHNNNDNNKNIYTCNVLINHKYFIEELEDYNESLSFDKQTGKSKKIIDYYLNLINKNK